MYYAKKMNLRSAGLMAVLCVLLGACSGRHGEVTLRIVATTDVHGCIYDRDLMTGDVREGSLAKVSSFLKGQRKQNRNLIYLDAGDILQGSIDVYHDVTAQFDRIGLAAKAYSELGLDAMAFGNHEMAAGIPTFEKFYEESPFLTLGANVYFDKYGDYLPPCTIIERHGVKVAVLGLTSSVVRYSVPSDRVGGLAFSDIVETSKYIVPILRDGNTADVVIGLVHSGYEDGRMDDEGVFENDVHRLASEVPGFDLIIYGHDHEARCLKIAGPDGDSVLVMNSGPYALNAAVADITVDFRNSPEGRVTSVSGHLEDMTRQAVDPAFVKSLSEWYADAAVYADSVIGYVDKPFESRGVLWRSSSAMDYIHSIQLGYQRAEISLASPVSSRTYIPGGDVTLRNLFELYKYDNTMVLVMLSGREIKDILEYSTGLYYNTVKRGGDNLLKLSEPDADGIRMPQTPVNFLITAAGIDYVVDVTKPAGERVKILSMSDGRPFDADRMYRTTVNSFLYGGTESALFHGAGIRHKDMPKRLELSSSADVRYFMITDFSLSKESGKQVRLRGCTNWKLIPEGIVQECLAKDTIDFSIIRERTGQSINE